MFNGVAISAMVMLASVVRRISALGFPRAVGNLGRMIGQAVMDLISLCEKVLFLVVLNAMPKRFWPTEEHVLFPTYCLTTHCYGLQLSHATQVTACIETRY